VHDLICGQSGALFGQWQSAMPVAVIDELSRSARRRADTAWSVWRRVWLRDAQIESARKSGEANVYNSPVGAGCRRRSQRREQVSAERGPAIWTIGYCLR